MSNRMKKLLIPSHKVRIHLEFGKVIEYKCSEQFPEKFNKRNELGHFLSD